MNKRTTKPIKTQQKEKKEVKLYFDLPVFYCRSKESCPHRKGKLCGHVNICKYQRKTKTK